MLCTAILFTARDWPGFLIKNNYYSEQKRSIENIQYQHHPENRSKLIKLE